MNSLAFILLSFVVSIFALPNGQDNRMRLLFPAKLIDKPIKMYAEPRLGFSWGLCDSTVKYPAMLQSLTISPSPLHLPGAVTVSASGTVAADIKAPIKVALVIHKKVLGQWFKIPCVDNLGSCTYDDICTKLPPPTQACPPILQKYGIPCHCPVPKGSYNLPSSTMNVNVPVEIPSGDYEINIQASANGVLQSCVNAQFSIA